jgi:diguanylate cyclase (GGDEF)-like protein
MTTDGGHSKVTNVPKEPKKEPQVASRPRSLKVAPRATKIVYSLIYISCALVAIAALVTARIELKPLVQTSLLLGLYVVFEEVSRRESSLRIRLSNGPRPDMTSVWNLAAAVVLPLGYAVVLISVLRGHRWFRHQRDVRPYAAWFGFSTSVLSCAAAHYVVVAINRGVVEMPGAITRALVIGLAIVAYTTVNRLLVYVAFGTWRGLNGQTIVGSWDDNLLEMSTLCLGGLASVAVLYEPWLTPLVLMPMILLQRGALIRELETVASTDSKTGLLNAIAWEQLAQRELSRSSRDSLSVAIMIIDLDRFKAVNDVYGHLVGDVVLREVGRCLIAELRDYDTVGRFGGEEFVALLPDVGAIEAGVIAERVRARINTLQMSVLSPTTEVDRDSVLSASIGVACFPQDGSELQELLHASDAALYVAKNGGRNRVEFAKSASA